MTRRECYICHQHIEHYEYTNHVASHLASGDTGIHPRPAPSPAAITYDTIDDDHHGRAFPVHSTPPRFRARAPSVPDRVLRDEAPVGPPVQQNAFHVWLKNPTRYAPKYTTIDGHKSGSDSTARFREAAEILRGSTKEEVVKIVEEFKGFSSTGSDKATCLELVRKAPIYPGLVAYTYTHLSVCPRRGWFFNDDWSDRVSELKRLVEQWADSGDVRCILGCSGIKRRLLELVRVTKIRPEEHKCNSALLNGTTVLNHDIRNLACVVALCITGPQKVDVLDQRGAQAEELVELFHNLLEANIELDEGYRRCFLNPLIQLSKAFAYCPRGIYLEENAVSGLVAVTGGGFGDVYKGMVGSRLVAVKALRRGGQSLPEYSKQVSKEVIVWRHFCHPNCLPLYGVYRMPTEGPNIIVGFVSPWMDQGNLSTYLECNPRANRTQLILDIVHGLNYLHSMQPHVAHRDIKPVNILITSKGRACLADFGLVSAFDADSRFHTATSQIVIAGTCYYMAPELFNAENEEDRRKVNKRACDMYALGCTIYATYTGLPPFCGMGPVQLRTHVISNKRPEFPQGEMPPDMWSFVENLWCQDPHKRLTAEMALGWMQTKARQENVDPNLAPFEEEWQWRGARDECLWSVSL